MADHIITPDEDAVTSPKADLVSLAVVSLLDGALQRNLVASRNEAISCALLAALTFAVDTHGRGAETKALEHTRILFNGLVDRFEEGIANQTIRGGQQGGFDRR